LIRESTESSATHSQQTLHNLLLLLLPLHILGCHLLPHFVPQKLLQLLILLQ
jgi:hypothetical protein